MTVKSLIGLAPSLFFGILLSNCLFLMQIERSQINGEEESLTVSLQIVLKLVQYDPFTFKRYDLCQKDFCQKDFYPRDFCLKVEETSKCFNDYFSDRKMPLFYVRWHLTGKLN
jgi:hypothetical protein